MTSILSRILSLFGGKEPAAPAPAQESRETYQDVELVAQPIKEGSQYRIAGRIEKKDGDRVMVRHFIRADIFSGEKEAVEFTIRKAKQIVDQHGVSLFRDGAAEGRV
jgi:hypothetical protein